jgi:hypothetical protein
VLRSRRPAAGYAAHSTALNAARALPSATAPPPRSKLLLSWCGSGGGGGADDAAALGGGGGATGDEPAPASASSNGIINLDMGEYKLPHLDVAAALSGLPQQRPGGASAAAAAAVAAAAAASQAASGGRGASMDGSAAAAAAAAAATAAATAIAPDGGGGAAAAAHLLRVYALLPTCLAERAREWGSRLTLKEGARQTERGFFDAPGATAAASLVPTAAALAGGAMPSVTAVFAAVEDARLLTRGGAGAAAARGPAAEAARLLRTVVHATLAAVPGGYLCREQEGKMRFMLAFPDAGGALQVREGDGGERAARGCARLPHQLALHGAPPAGSRCRPRPTPWR